MRWTIELLVAHLQRYRARAEVLERDGHYNLADDLNEKAEQILDRIARIRLYPLTASLTPTPVP